MAILYPYVDNLTQLHQYGWPITPPCLILQLIIIIQWIPSWCNPKWGPTGGVSNSWPLIGYEVCCNSIYRPRASLWVLWHDQIWEHPLLAGKVQISPRWRWTCWISEFFNYLDFIPVLRLKISHLYIIWVQYLFLCWIIQSDIYEE